MRNWLFLIIERFIKKDTKMRAFTLAELLITIAIVGVVAVITLPNLYKTIQKSILSAQFKTTYSKLTNALRKMQAEGELPNCTGWYTGCENFYPMFLKQFKITQICNNNALAKGCLPPGYHGVENLQDISVVSQYSTYAINNAKTIYVFASGEIFFTYWRGESNYFVVDINGRSGPNKWGYDIHSFSVNTNKGTIGAYWTFVERGGTSTNDMIKNLKMK